MIILVETKKSYAEEIFRFKQEMIDQGDVGLPGCGGLHRYDSYEEWISHLQQYYDKKQLPKDSNYVEGRQFLLVDTSNERILGMVNIRHYLNDFLLGFGGHIGYSIRPSERRKGYGKLQLQLALDYLDKRGVERVLVTCDEQNLGSAKTIESCGGELENIVSTDEHGTVKRYWIQNK